MSVPAKRLIYELTRRMDYRNLSKGQSMKVVDKCSYLTEALFIYFDNKSKISEIDERTKKALEIYEEKEVGLKRLEKASRYIIFQLPPDLHKRLRQRAVISTETCGKRDASIRMITTDKLNEALRSPYWEPSYQWGETVGDEGRKGLYVWHNNEFDIDEVFIDYYRKPKEIHAPSLTKEGKYIDWSGEERTKDSDLEIDTVSAWRNIVDIAYLIAARDAGQLNDFQSQLSKILNVEKIN